MGRWTTGVHKGVENREHLKDMLACEVSGETEGWESLREMEDLGMSGKR